MNTLRDLRDNILPYDNTQGVWAELIDGEFSLDSKYRIGQFSLDNGGILDGWAAFESCEGIECYIDAYLDGIEDDDHQWREEAVSSLISIINQDNL